MKRQWWIWIALFFLGFSLGSQIGLAQTQDASDVTFYSPSTAPTVSVTPTVQPEAPETQPTEAPPDEEVSALPCAMQYTSLVAHSLAAYDGPSLEDGTGEELVGVAALILENTGTIGIHYAQVVLIQDGTELVFDATYIPPRGTVLIVESNLTPYSSAEVESCRCKTVIPGSFDWSEDQVSVTPTGSCSMAVTNLTDRALSCVRIFYKQHLSENDLYVGGITYSAIVTDLEPGETCVISPYGYACGYAQVVAVEVDTP